MTLDLPQTSDGLEQFESRLLSMQQAGNVPCFQCHSELWSAIPNTVIDWVAERISIEPNLGLRIYGAGAAVDLDRLRAFSDLRRLSLHYGIKDVRNIAALRVLKRIQTAELEIVAPFDTSFLNYWPRLENLSTIRESRASTRPDWSAVGELGNLKTWYNMGYAKGVDRIKNSASLAQVRLQSLTVKDWDILPKHRLELLSLNAVKGPEPFDPAPLLARVDELRLVRMDKLIMFKSTLATSAIHAKGQGAWFTLDLNYIGHFEGEQSGYSLLQLCEALVPMAQGITAQPEAGSLQFDGAFDVLELYRERLKGAFEARYRKS